MSALDKDQEPEQPGDEAGGAGGLVAMTEGLKGRKPDDN
jgi:hypothetical protein